MARIVYLHGFASGPQSRKAQYFRHRLEAAGVSLELPDLAAGDFEHLTMARQLAVLESLLTGEPATLIGSSLGGYLAALYASRHPETHKLILLAPAFAYGNRWQALVGPEAFAGWKKSGNLSVYHHGEDRYVNLAFDIVEESGRYEPYPAFPQSAQIFHGRQDTVVPPEYSERFASRNPNAELFLLDTDHGMLNALPEIWNAAAPFLAFAPTWPADEDSPQI